MRASAGLQPYTGATDAASIKNLVISDRAHVIFPWHIAEDRALDSSLAGGEAIGTTQRGIGPCYQDKVGRSYAIRLGDTRWVSRFLKRFPALRHARDTGGTPFRKLARESGNREIMALFGLADVP